jgi:dTDP-4-amino-4,6-dideoxygalactose transaminase
MPLLQPRLNYKLTWKDYFVAIRAIFFKEKLSKSRVEGILHTEKVLFFDHARSALQIALNTLPRNSKVGVQPFTCPTVLEAIENANCQVVFIDVNDKLVIDLDALKSKVNEIDALIYTHTFGFPGNIDEIISVMKGKLLIEDCAHAFMSENNNEKVGRKGDFSVFSYGFAKFPSAIQGGWLVVNNPIYFKAIELKYKSLKQPGFLYQFKILSKSLFLVVLNNRMIYTFVTSKIKNKRNENFIYTKTITKNDKIKRGINVCQSIFENQLEEIELKVELQKKKGQIVLNALAKNNSFSICQNITGMNFFMVPVIVKNPAHFIEYTKKSGIETGKHFVQSQFIINKFGYVTGACKNYERIVNKLVTLPCHYNYPEKELQKLVQLIITYKN